MNEKTAIAIAEATWGDKAVISMDFEAPCTERYRVGIMSDGDECMGVLGIGSSWRSAMEKARGSSVGQQFMKEIFLGD